MAERVTAKATKFVWALITLMLALIILFFALAWMHKTFGTNVVGNVADWLGKRSTGQAYQF